MCSFRSPKTKKHFSNECNQLFQRFWQLHHFGSYWENLSISTGATFTRTFEAWVVLIARFIPVYNFGMVPGASSVSTLGGTGICPKYWQCLMICLTELHPMLPKIFLLHFSWPKTIRRSWRSTGYIQKIYISKTGQRFGSVRLGAESCESSLLSHQVNCHQKTPLPFSHLFPLISRKIRVPDRLQPEFAIIEIN